MEIQMLSFQYGSPPFPNANISAGASVRKGFLQVIPLLLN